MGEGATSPTADQFRQLLDSVGQGVLAMDGLGRCTFTNAELCRLTGYPAAEIVGRDVHSLLHCSAAEGAICPQAECPILGAMQARESCRTEGGLRRRDGVSLPVDYASYPISGGPGAVVTIVDLSGRREMERAVRESEQRYRTLYEEAQDGILLWRDGVFIDCNPSMSKILRASRENIIGRSPLDLSPALQSDGTPTAVVAEQHVRSALAGVPVSFEWRFRRGDGSLGEADVSLNRIEIGGEATVMGVLHDVTERRQAEQVLHRSESRLREAQAIAHLGSWEWDVASGRSTWSDEMYRILGRPPGASLQTLEAALQVVHEADRERLELAVNDALAKRGSFAVDYRTLRGDGRECVVHAEGLVVSAALDPPRMIGTLQDVTERSRAERYRAAELEMTRVLAEAKSEAEAVHQAVERVGVVLESDVAEFWEVDADVLRHRSGWCRKPMKDFESASRSMTFARGIGLPGRVWAAGEPAWIEDLLGDSNLPRAPLAKAAGLRSGFAFPVAAERGEILGVIGLFFRSPRQPDVALLHILRGVGSMIGHFIRRKRAESAVEKSERYFRRLIENSSDLVGILDVDGVHKFHSPSVKRVLGYEPEELIGESGFSFVHPADLPIALAAMDGCRSSPAKLVSLQFRARHKDGSWRVLDAKLVNLLDDEVVHGIVVNARDVTEHRQAEADRALQSAALAAAANAILITDAQGSIHWVNSAFERLTGYSAPEVIGRNPRLLQSGQHDRSFYERLWKTIQSGDTWNGEMVNRRKDGTLYVEEMTVTPVRQYGTVAHFIAVKQDVTDRKQAEDRLRGALEKAQEADRLKSAFLSNMSHEVRTPLNAILGYNSLIADRLHELREESLDDALDAVTRASQRLLRTVHGIIDLSRIETGVFPTRPAALKLGAVLEQTVRAFRGQAEAKHLSLTCEIDATDAEISIDEYCLQQAVDRLLDNAIKFTERGEVAVALRRDASGILCLSVRDTGVGIDPSYLPRLFEPFSQQDTGYTRRYDGPGNGLALAKRYLGFNGAEISVQSEIGVGTTFTIRFLQSAAGAADGTGAARTAPASPGVSQPAPEVPATVRNGKKPVALVVEDDETSQRYVVTILRREFDVVVAASADEVRAQLAKHPDVALVLMDLSLKGGDDGLVLTRWIRSQPRWSMVPVIATTAHALSEDKGNALESGCNAYLAKPFSPADLLSVVDAVRRPPAEPLVRVSP